MNLISLRLLNHPSFNRYPQDMKDEMQQEGVLKQVRNLKNLDPSKGSLFAYLTQCCWTAFIVYLGHHYRQVNIKREVLTKALRSAEDRQDIQTTQYMKEYLKRLEEWKEEQEENNTDDF